MTTQQNLQRILYTIMPQLPVAKRIQNFEEVAIGYTDEQAKNEAIRCLKCKRPRCKQACPAGVRIPEFITEILEGRLEEAYEIIRTTNSFPAICARVCPQEDQCEGACILKAKGIPIAIGRLERYVADHAMNRNFGLYLHLVQTEPCKLIHPHLQVACIGSGPASLAAAEYLVSQGIHVTIFDSFHEPGGVLAYGIPTFRLPRKILDTEIRALQKKGVTFKTQRIGDGSISIQQLFDKGYKAIFIGIGAGLPYQLGIPGENSSGVFLANEYLAGIKLGNIEAKSSKIARSRYIGRNVTVFGAGNVAMDASRTAIRLGAESVHIMYRRTKAEMPARHEEVKYAEEEGIKFMELVSPLAFNSNEENKLYSVIVQRMKLVDSDVSGRRGVTPVTDDIFEYPTDLAIIAIGNRSNPVFLETMPGLEVTKEGYIITNEVGETSIPNIFAGGDIVTGAATVVLAMNAGRNAGQEIAKRLLEK